ncbi:MULTISPECIES: 30S ribosomal protein S6 [Acidaminococcus]|uniref:Small ribosomal subunit protein bS6 n=2 Tax=Acidaminococcus fermentans TaxID=905 RepID=D2RN21_ACIFV|nr:MULTISPECIES: 30S ribosomal protein S6 [Acidaminococcus]ADB46447.1 ribosomal protein S6 [Acidaminococcus fermentans DSM 20731]MCF0140036.1 30S ribosomal protein S6 [Acidaminococcus fermentans]MCI6286237.1 30S ribosomal protein S6 [Acidaminococcus fermentans]MCI7193996.1 30S ribosomal protein S6 [Acidaminococcus fermentans]MDD6288499.1 30S ribosomal protein S6 [Acidaminococcus fermentans]
MNNYEVMYIVKPVEEDAFNAVVKKFDDLLVANGATIEKTDKWGKKRLAYAIQDFNDGLYVLTTFAAEPAAVKELDRVMKITDDILRHMIIRKGE